MNDAQRFSDLVGAIYDAALDPTLWSDVLHNTADFVGGVAAALFMKDTVRRAHNSVHTWGYDPDFTRTYIEKYVALDPFTIGQLLFREGDVVSLVDLVDVDEFKESRFYREWVRPQGWIDAIGGTLERTATSYAAMSVIRGERNGMADDGARSRMQLIVPHIRCSVLIGKVIDLHKVEAAALADTLDGLAAAMFLVDGGGRIVHANASGHAMLEQGSVLRAAAGKLAAADAHAETVLERIFANAAAGDAAIGADGIAVPLAARDGERYVAHVLPLTSGARKQAGVAYSAVAAVFVRKASLDLPHPIETIADTFKLTPAEMRVLMMIVEVGGVPEVASVLGVSETTVKTHLQHVFAKTGTARQADLVKLVAGYMSPLA